MNKILLKSIFIPLLLGIISCDQTSSDERFERATDIEIPNDVEVLKDEYQDMLQDYGIEYNIQLTTTQLEEVITSIRSSEFYNPSVIGDANSQDEYFLNESANASWFKTNSGYSFINRNNRTGVAAKLDTLTSVLEFSEWHD